MKKNIKVARDLVKIAKTIVASDADDKLVKYISKTREFLNAVMKTELKIGPKGNRVKYFAGAFLNDNYDPMSEMTLKVIVDDTSESKWLSLNQFVLGSIAATKSVDDVLSSREFVDAWHNALSLTKSFMNRRSELNDYKNAKYIEDLNKYMSKFPPGIPDTEKSDHIMDFDRKWHFRNQFEKLKDIASIANIKRCVFSEGVIEYDMKVAYDRPTKTFHIIEK